MNGITSPARKVRSHWPDCRAGKAGKTELTISQETCLKFGLIHFAEGGMNRKTIRAWPSGQVFLCAALDLFFDYQGNSISFNGTSGGSAMVGFPKVFIFIMASLLLAAIACGADATVGPTGTTSGQTSQSDAT